MFEAMNNYCWFIQLTFTCNLAYFILPVWSFKTLWTAWSISCHVFLLCQI